MDLLGPVIQSMLEGEMSEHLGYEPYERWDEPNSRNGKKDKRLRRKYGEIPVAVPQDRESTFEPKVVKKRQKEISSIESMYAKGMTTRQISEQIDDIYGFEVSEGLISDITDKLLPQIEKWQHRPLSKIYPILFINAIHFSVRDNGVIRKLAAYVILGVNEEGRKPCKNKALSISHSIPVYIATSISPYPYSTGAHLPLINIIGELIWHSILLFLINRLLRRWNFYRLICYN